MLRRNVGNQLPNYAAQVSRRAKASIQLINLRNRLCNPCSNKKRQLYVIHKSEEGYRNEIQHKTSDYLYNRLDVKEMNFYWTCSLFEFQKVQIS